MSATGQNFIVIGENMHATRVLLKKSERIALNGQGRKGSSSRTRMASLFTCASLKRRKPRRPTQKAASST